MTATLKQLSSEINEAGWLLYYDVSPLFEEHWTGISVAAAGLARAMLGWMPESCRFFYEHTMVPREAVEDAIDRGSGLFLARGFFQGRAQMGPLSLLDESRLAAGIYPSVKRVTQLFPIECSIYHDISTLITPQFHIMENIRHHITGLVDDLRTNAITFGVSVATVEDLRAYLGADERRTFVAPNGVSWPWWYPIQAENELDLGRIEPYFLVLGTREPRKNVSRVLEMLTIFPEALDSARFVIAGRRGWLQDDQSIPPAIATAIEEQRILFPGFVSDFEKYKLLRGAVATIYPSFFEGFGLPVLESLSVGTPCIASFSSSIPEVGGDACVYFDPFSAESLYAAVQHVQGAGLKQQPEFLSACRALTERFTWDNMLERILVPLVEELRNHRRQTC
ncbi:MAG: glycosyltransferase family 4 protein [Acidisphaera sp.]|nr:glycosyltransferase family 4 protein [Acidisphaera sp.]